MIVWLQRVFPMLILLEVIAWISVFMKKEMKEKMMILSPIMAIGFSWCMNRFLLAVISLVSIFLCISVCSVCRKHESLWLFVLSGIATIPANIFLISGEMHLSLS